MNLKKGRRAAEERCEGLQCELASLKMDLAAEQGKTAAHMQQLEQRQQEADALAKALMERSVEVEDMSLEMEQWRERLATAEQRCMDAHAAMSACQREAKVLRGDNAGSQDPTSWQ